MASKGKRVEAVAYLRTSSATNVGEGKAACHSTLQRPDESPGTAQAQASGA